MHERSEGSRVASVCSALILLAGLAHVAFAIAAIGGAETLEANVQEIESNSDFGELYFALSTWGWILLLVGAVELGAAASIWRRTPNWRLAGQTVAYVGLIGAFFTLAIFRFASLATIVLLVLAIFVLSRDSGRGA